jgi:hypothetical protein
MNLLKILLLKTAVAMIERRAIPNIGSLLKQRWNLCTFSVR